MARGNTTQEKGKMSTLTVRILEDHKTALAEVAKSAGLIRMEDGEPTGNISALITLLATSLPKENAEDVKRLLFKKTEV